MIFLNILKTEKTNFLLVKKAMTKKDFFFQFWAVKKENIVKPKFVKTGFVGS